MRLTAAKTPVSTTTGPREPGSCVEHSRKEEVILILCKVVDEYILVRRQRARGSEHVVLVPLSGHPLGDWRGARPGFPSRWLLAVTTPLGGPWQHAAGSGLLRRALPADRRRRAGPGRQSLVDRPGLPVAHAGGIRCARRNPPGQIGRAHGCTPVT